MADPLSLLRQYNIRKKKIVQCGDQIIIGEFSWPRNVKTNYVIWGTDKTCSTKDYYTLECLLFLVNNSGSSYTTYFQQACAANVPFVRRPDWKDLLAYVNGDSVWSASIDKSAPLPNPVTTQNRKLYEDDAVSPDNALISDNYYINCSENGTHGEKKDDLVVDNAKSISEAMTIETIAAIKAKRLARKRKSNKINNDKLETESILILEVGNDITKFILSRERHWRTRNSILQDTGKLSSDSILSILGSVKKKEGGIKPPVVSKPQMNVAYDRYDQQKFVRQKEVTDDFQIDTTRTYHGLSLRLVTEGIRSKRLPSPERIPPKPVPDEYVPVQPCKPASRTPIIIIPAAPTSLITMYNARDILQDLKFVSSEEKKRQGMKRDNEVLLQRRKGNVTVPYRLTDNPQKLTYADWERVVAVFVMGPAWQFKGWPYNGNPTDLFSHICAFHVKYDEMTLHNNIARWAVNVIDVSRTKRHLDRAAFQVFWEKLDKHMIKNKPNLRF